MAKARTQYDELVTAEAGHGIDAPSEEHQATPHLAKDLVAGVMAERVVDLLEAVEVHKHEGERAPGRRDVGLIEEKGLSLIHI